MLLVHFYVGECIAQSRNSISSPKSQSFLENIPFLYGGKNQGLLIAHLMLCSRRHLHRHIFGLKHITSQDFNILYPVRWGGFYLSSDYGLLFAQTLYFSKIQKLQISFYLYTCRTDASWKRKPQAIKPSASPTYLKDITDGPQFSTHNY